MGSRGGVGSRRQDPGVLRARVRLRPAGSASGIFATRTGPGAATRSGAGEDGGVFCGGRRSGNGFGRGQYSFRRGRAEFHSGYDGHCRLGCPLGGGRAGFGHRRRGSRTGSLEAETGCAAWVIGVDSSAGAATGSSTTATDCWTASEWINSMIGLHSIRGVAIGSSTTATDCWISSGVAAFL